MIITLKLHQLVKLLQVAESGAAEYCSRIHVTGGLQVPTIHLRRAHIKPFRGQGGRNRRSLEIRVDSWRRQDIG